MFALAAAGVALLALGLAGGYAIGRSTSPVPANVAAPVVSAPALPDQSAKFAGTRAASLAGPWLPELGNCLSAADPGGPKLENGRAEMINCQIGDVQVYFETFTSATQFGWTRDYRAGISRKSGTLVPGVEPPRQKTGPVSGRTGTYFEYVTGKTCGVFWGPGGSLTDVRLEADCAAIGNHWPSLRAVWERFS
ncbi:hypothetical protein MB27_22705 [Actinoplanes utahensis]|uniref:Uncharacterized protein n=1 Tax=Actinoplanes utahensis TaxID=1869 RepID=A0A0A6UK45_ACTUT|nr:hypothetical protein MB27_22705 [Actinoplanes utahensis]